MRLRQSLHQRGWRTVALCAALVQVLSLLVLGGSPIAAAAPSNNNNNFPLPHFAGAYTNPLSVHTTDGQTVQSCADPSIIRSQTPGDADWYIYCTSDALNDNNKDANGNYIINLIPTLKSYDMVHWTYVGNVFASRPSWVAPTAGLWAPDIHYFNNQYYLYYTASDTSLPGGGSAIGVATAPTPAGPWTDSGQPVVAPEDGGRWIYDPMVIEDSGQRYIFFGSYFGGISARKLSADGLTSDPTTETQIAIPNRYEGTFIVKHDGYYYFFGSATNCCNGPLTGYSVFAARSKNILGPYVDANGYSILDSAVGGTPVISMNGNQWVGPGHNAVFTDFQGQDWFLYHAVNQNDPYYTGQVGYTKRPVLMDRLDWINGWPEVRAGKWASNTPQPAPAAQPGWFSFNPDFPPAPLNPGRQINNLSDDFNGTALSSQWSWVRQPDPSTYSVSNGAFNFDTQNADLYVDSNNASVLTEPTPQGDYVVETKVHLNVPPSGCCYNYVQAALVIYHDDDNFIKLADFSDWETRQTEFAKELKPVPDGYPRYGNTVGGNPNPSGWTYLRIVKQSRGNLEYYTAFTSADGTHWVRGGVWTHQLGSTAKIGLVSMGGSGFTANFDYVHVYRLNPADDFLQN